MKVLLLRIGLFAAIIACACGLLWTPFGADKQLPMRFDDFILCVAIQTCVPLIVWIVLCMRPTSLGIQAGVTLLWTWLVSLSLVLVAERFHDSSVYQPPRPWDYLFREGGIIIYPMLMVPIFSVIAAALTFVPFARRARK